ncbi:hypothetical protein TREES_T100019135 [Tupaia chinensis]|uniref:Uncharacterized protein n=1 Tax=Tupaia chinensis TaxID=246437 RepID=L9LEQ2_TUPCH|nr:hypothetical protein TREES_T100019135 [Tupaia chinensis]
MLTIISKCPLHVFGKGISNNKGVHCYKMFSRLALASESPFPVLVIYSNVGRQLSGLQDNHIAGQKKGDGMEEFQFQPSGACELVPKITEEHQRLYGTAALAGNYTGKREGKKENESEREDPKICIF